MKGLKTILVTIIALLVVATGLTIATTQTSEKYTIDNTIIVLPTTKIVNGTPLHIGEDAIAGSKLGAWLMYNSINVDIQEAVKTVTASAEYHSIILRDSDQVYYLTETDMPDVGLPLATTPDDKHISIYVNFSKVAYNTTAKAYTFKDGAIGIRFTTNSSPIKLWDTDEKVLVKMGSNNSNLYVYSFKENDEYKSIGDEFKVDSFTIEILDISTETDRVLIKVVPPQDEPFTDIVSINEVKIYYIDSEGDFKEATTTNVNTLLTDGVEKVYKFKVVDIFSGLSNNMARIQSEYYCKIQEYKNGQVYTGNWIWNIIDENTFELKLHIDPEKDFPEVKLSQSNPELKFPVGDLRLKAYWEKDKEGDITDHYLRFTKPVEVKETVTYQTQEVTYNKPTNIIWTDEQFTSVKPSNKNVIIIGGWVSNKAWAWLEETLGKSTIEAWKNEVMEKGYIVKEVQNGDYKIVVLAGKDYIGTAQAVDYFINNILLQA